MEGAIYTRHVERQVRASSPRAAVQGAQRVTESMIVNELG